MIKPVLPRAPTRGAPTVTTIDASVTAAPNNLLIFSVPSVARFFKGHLRDQ